VLSWPTRHWELSLLLVLLLLYLHVDSLPPGMPETQVRRHVAGQTFRFTSWEVQALLRKVAHALLSPQRYMDEPARHDFFLAHLRLINTIQELDWQIQQSYADPQVADPAAATAEARARLAGLRAEQAWQQLLAESIMEEQTAVAAFSEGFGSMGQVFPPVASHFTPLPLLLVVSPRERIETLVSVSLRHGLNTAEQEEIEARIDSALNVSSLVTRIGGMAAYPAMLLESSSAPWVIEVTAHEWTHHYLTLRPLGWNYDASPEARTINETVASIVGKELGRRVIARYYPELLPPEPEPEAQSQAAEQQPAEPPRFDFRAEMRETRIRVDQLLAEGKVEEAEAYMEERRLVFVANGYAIRKLNQAYFAFHGAYADEPGAAGADPIGPLVNELRARSPSLHTFVARIARITTRAELEALLQTAAR